MTSWLTREILNLLPSQRGEAWHLLDSAFFLPEFCSVYSTYLIFCPIKGQAVSLLINQRKQQMDKDTPISADAMVLLPETDTG